MIRSALFSTTKRSSTLTYFCQFRSIAIGTDLTKTSSLSWQKARPWVMDDEPGSNMAADNAVSMKDLFKDKTVAVFGVPAPFTGTCSNEHYPPYAELADDFYKQGCDCLVCYSVSDPYAHRAWAKNLGNDFDKIVFMADPDGDFAKAHDLDADYSATSLGKRSKRFSMLVKDGIVQAFHLVEDASKDAETLLEDAKKLK
jgi:peroxiredoxin